MFGGGAGTTPVAASALPGPLGELAEQLWFALDPDVVFAVSGSRRHGVSGHRLVEQYAVVPTLRNPRILLPTGPVAASRGSAVNYRHLRGSRERSIRVGLGLAARTGFAMAPSFLHVLVPASRPEAADSLPLQAVSAALGERDLRTSIGIRTGANRKPVLQVVHNDGSPAGYAKFGWNRKTDGYVRTETAALDALARLGSGRVKVPRRLVALEYADHPVVVTEPLPPAARAVRPGKDGPTPAEFHDLAPVVRTDRMGSVGQVKALRDRVGSLSSPVVDTQLAQAARLLDQVAAEDPDLVVSARWHGDFTHWNAARDVDGALWVWDWEEYEEDALAGLDVLHWVVSFHRAEINAGTFLLTECLAAAAPHLTASGVPRQTWDALLRIYLAVAIEREAELAAEDGGWDRTWIRPERIDGLVDQLRRRVDAV